MKNWSRPGMVLLFLALSFILVLTSAFPSMAEDDIPVYIILDFNDPVAAQFRGFLEKEIVKLGYTHIVGKDHLGVEDCAVVSVVGFRFKGRSGEDLGFPFSYAFGYSEPGDGGFWYEYHNVLVGYADTEGLIWAAEEIADDLDYELMMFW